MQALVCAIVIEAGEQVTLTEVIVGGGGFTTTVAVPLTSVEPTCAEVAIIVTLVADATDDDDVNVPVEEMLPAYCGLTLHVTVEE